MFGVDPTECDVGEEWDWNAMACVTAGQAVTPTPQLPPPSALPPPPSFPSPAPAPAPVPPPSFFEKYKTPILVVGAIVVAGTVAYLIADSRSTAATPNKKRGTVKHRGTVRKRRLARYKAYGSSWGPGGSVVSVPPGKKLYKPRLKTRR